VIVQLKKKAAEITKEGWGKGKVTPGRNGEERRRHSRYNCNETARPETHWRNLVETLNKKKASAEGKNQVTKGGRKGMKKLEPLV